MKIKKGFVLREIADTIVVVPTGVLLNEFKGVMNLNETGKFIWELLQENDMTVEEIANKLVEVYGLEKDKALESTVKFIEKLKNVNVFED